MSQKKSHRVQLHSCKCVKMDPNFNDVSNFLNKVWETKLCPNWALFKYLEMSQRIDIQSAMSFFIWKFKTQTMVKRMIVNQIGKLTLTIKMSNKRIKWPPIQTSIQHWILFSRIVSFFLNILKLEFIYKNHELEKLYKNWNSQNP